MSTEQKPKSAEELARHRKYKLYVQEIAIHEAESKLNAEQQIRYARLLHELFTGQRHYLHVDFDVLHTTAAQRCEALCRVLWPERFSEQPTTKGPQ